MSNAIASISRAGSYQSKRDHPRLSLFCLMLSVLSFAYCLMIGLIFFYFAMLLSICFPSHEKLSLNQNEKGKENMHTR